MLKVLYASIIVYLITIMVMLVTEISFTFLLALTIGLGYFFVLQTIPYVFIYMNKKKREDFKQGILEKEIASTSEIKKKKYITTHEIMFYFVGFVLFFGWFLASFTQENLLNELGKSYLINEWRYAVPLLCLLYNIIVFTIFRVIKGKHARIQIQ